jgi:hypothetical protein
MNLCGSGSYTSEMLSAFSLWLCGENVLVPTGPGEIEGQEEKGKLNV